MNGERTQPSRGDTVNPGNTNPEENRRDANSGQPSPSGANVVIDLIDDDEWLELGLLLAGIVSRLPEGSRLVEAVQVPPFRLAISAAGIDMPNVITRPSMSGLFSPDDVVRAAIDLAESEYKLTSRSTPDAVAITLTQSADGEHYAVAVVGLPGERRSFMTFGLPPGGHSIDIGELALNLLEGWAIRRPATAAA